MYQQGPVWVNVHRIENMQLEGAAATVMINRVN